MLTHDDTMIFWYGVPLATGDKISHKITYVLVKINEGIIYYAVDSYLENIFKSQMLSWLSHHYQTKYINHDLLNYIVERLNLNVDD